MSLHYGYRSGETGSSRNEKYSAAYQKAKNACDEFS